MDDAPLDRPGVLYLSVSLIAVCGIIYELIIGAASSYLLGDSILQFSVTIGLFMSALGLGSWASALFKRHLFAVFLTAELLIGLVGGASALILFGGYAALNDFYPVLQYGLTLVIGALVGVEIPILMRLLEDRHALQTEVLTHSPHRLWLPAQHPLLERDSIGLADVAGEPLIQLNADEMGLHTQRIWSRAGLVPQVTLRTASVEAVRSLVAAGLGLSIQPDMTYRPWSLEGDIIEARPLVDLGEPLDVGLAWRRGTARPALVDPFLTVAREQPNAKRLSI